MRSSITILLTLKSKEVTKWCSGSQRCGIWIILIFLKQLSILSAFEHQFIGSSRYTASPLRVTRRTPARTAPPPLRPLEAFSRNSRSPTEKPIKIARIQRFLTFTRRGYSWPQLFSHKVSCWYLISSLSGPQKPSPHSSCENGSPNRVCPLHYEPRTSRP